MMRQLFTYGVLAIIVIFQPEFRRALEQLGRGTLFSRTTVEDDINELSNMIKSALATSGCHFERKNIKEKFDQMAELINKL